MRLRPLPASGRSERLSWYERIEQRSSCFGSGLRRARRLFSWDLLRDAVVLGVLLGCFYAAVSVGLSISFGLLDVPHVAHPAFLVLASYGVYLLNDLYDLDPLIAGFLLMPVFFLIGLVTYRL